MEFDDKPSSQTKKQFKTYEDYENRRYPMDIRYVWNWSLLNDFYLQQIEPFWTIIAIQGFFSNHIEIVDLITKLEEMIEVPPNEDRNA